MTISWETPAPKSRNKTLRTELVSFLAELDAHPGEWAVWSRAGSPSAAQYTRELSGPNYEWTQRTNPDGSALVTVYARRKV